MQMQIDSIKEYKITRHSKCGILSYVANLEEFALNADVLLKSDRRADLEKWYTRLVDTMLDYISVHSGQHHKTPSQVIKMGTNKAFIQGNENILFCFRKLPPFVLAFVADENLRTGFAEEGG